MASLKETAFRKLRKELGRYPNLELAEQMTLGMIGLFDSRHAKFEWRTTLDAMGFNAVPMLNANDVKLTEEIFTIGQNVSFNFSADAASHGIVDFQFENSFSIATKANTMRIQRYNLEALQRQINERIVGERFPWDMKWVIVTTVYSTNSFTLLVSKSGNSHIQIKTGVPINLQNFDIADPTLQLNVSLQHNIGLCNICTANVTPFFQIHSLIRDNAAGNYQLKPPGTVISEFLRRFGI